MTTAALPAATPTECPGPASPSASAPDMDVDALVRRIGPAGRHPILRSRQFPYRAEADDPPDICNAISEAIGEVITSNEGILHKLIIDRLQCRARPDTDEYVQRVRVRLWQYSIPKFDAWRGYKLSTFVYACARNDVFHFRREIRNAISKCERGMAIATVSFGEAEAALMIAAPNTSRDRHIERLADQIICDPEAYLTPQQSHVLRALMQMPAGGKLQDLAQSLGYKRASSLSMVFRRIKERLAEIDLDEVVIAEGTCAT